MWANLYIKHPKVNFRARLFFCLDIDECPNPGDVLDLSSLLEYDLPSVVITDIYHYSHIPFCDRMQDIRCTIKDKITKTKCNQLFKEEDGWTVYG